MRDVAALAGVSLKTVSRVVNGARTVDPELAERVHRAAARLEYRPNLAAANLRRNDGRTRTIGVLLENIANPFSSAIQRAIEDAAITRGVAVLAGSLDEDPARERALALALAERRVDGLVIAPAGPDQSYLATEQRSGLSVVAVDRPARLLAADCVRSDSRRGAALGVRHLVRHGHRRIAFLGDQLTIATAVDRLEGYRDALQEAGIVFDPDLVRADLHTEDSAAGEAGRLLDDRRPTAVFASQNLITIGTIRALRERGIAHRIALVGFDDFLLANLLDPPITVVAQDPRRIGSRACEFLFERMDGRRDAPRSELLTPELRIRGSGEIPGA
jgi:LacI family transcriptional regulator